MALTAEICAQRNVQQQCKNQTQICQGKNVNNINKRKKSRTQNNVGIVCLCTKVSIIFCLIHCICESIKCLILKEEKMIKNRTVLNNS